MTCTLQISDFRWDLSWGSSYSFMKWDYWLKWRVYAPPKSTMYMVTFSGVTSGGIFQNTPNFDLECRTYVSQIWLLAEECHDSALPNIMWGELAGYFAIVKSIFRLTIIYKKNPNILLYVPVSNIRLNRRVDMWWKLLCQTTDARPFYYWMKSLKSLPKGYL